MHGIAVACQVNGVSATPEQRATIERMPPKLHLETSYYGSGSTRQTPFPRPRRRAVGVPRLSNGPVIAFIFSKER